MKEFYQKIEEIIFYAEEVAERNGEPDVFFRGNKKSTYSLLPGLARIDADDLVIFENRIYYDFVQYGGHLIPPNKNTWDILFLMQHHGLPTRLLDWSESLLTALYFAIKESSTTNDAAIWVLDPFGLNNKTIKKQIIDFFDVDFPQGYYYYFVDKDFPEYYGKFPNEIIAIGVNPPNQRIVAQRGTFTFHNNADFKKPLEELHPEFVKKFIIEKDLFRYAKKFLNYSGYNEFSMFPDLDGLARYIKNVEL